ncbi:unnamed protein product [Calicophoron daubneyi]|uniref:GYF domain-containing protein n=1 Tax=Calicophoron daubneyi TaxID=300641 RepID=A0AAV2T0U6_CALDB
MSKRAAIGEVTIEDKSKPVKISKPSLDSDEEDYQEEECFRLREADIEGQETATLEYDDDIKITPFNMKEELEEDGYFDGAGNFVFKKSVDARDNWLENVDWVEVNRRQHTNRPTDTSISDEPGTKPLEKTEKLRLYQQLFELMNPKETVLRSIKRMGNGSGGSVSASQKWLKKNQKKAEQYQSLSCNSDPEGLIRATELADQLLQAGEFDVYQTTKETIGYLIQKANETASEDELDALGEALDEKPGQNAQNGGGTSREDGTNKPQDGNDTQTAVQWHLKQSADGPLEGPYTTKQLKQWVDQGKYKDTPCVLVRQVDKPEGQFYNIKRIDFDLYE